MLGCDEKEKEKNKQEKEENDFFWLENHFQLPLRHTKNKNIKEKIYRERNCKREIYSFCQRMNKKIIKNNNKKLLFVFFCIIIIIIFILVGC